MPFDARQKSLLYHEFAKLTGAGFGIDKAARTILDQRPPAHHKTYAEGLLHGLDQGKSIAESITSTSLALNDIEIRLVDAAEKGGRLESAFTHLAHYFEMVDRTAQEARGKLIYPIVLVHLAILLPALPKAIASGGGLLGILKSAFIPLLLLYVVVAVTIITWRFITTAAQSNPSIDRFLNRIPLLGKVRRSFAFARFSKVFEIFLLAGRKPDESLRAAADASVSAHLKSSCAPISANLQTGQSLGPQVLDHPAFPPAYSRALSTAEESGTLEQDLGRWAKLFTADAEESLSRFGNWSTKALYGLAVLFVVWQIIATFMKVYIEPLNHMLNL